MIVKVPFASRSLHCCGEAGYVSALKHIRMFKMAKDTINQHLQSNNLYLKEEN